MKTYFLERCSGGAKNSHFWPTVIPFFSKKCKSGEQKIVLCENNKIINSTKQVTEHFNSFFSTVSNNIGSDVSYNPSTHPSILKIKSHNNKELTFQFEKTSAGSLEKIINKINIKKATGVDGIPSKIVKKTANMQQCHN